MHRSDYRIVKIRKEGYYTYYVVQRKILLFFWYNCSGLLDTIKDAERRISDTLVVETKEVVG